MSILPISVLETDLQVPFTVVRHQLIGIDRLTPSYTILIHAEKSGIKIKDVQ